MPSSTVCPQNGMYNSVFKPPYSVIPKRYSPDSTSCKRYFCGAVNPSFCFFLSFARSSITPIRPLARAIARVIIIPLVWETPIFTATRTHEITPTATEAAMKDKPHIVGVPSLLLCHCGPISSIFCPILWRLSTGIKKCAMMAVITAVAAAAQA